MALPLLRRRARAETARQEADSEAFAKAVDVVAKAFGASGVSSPRAPGTSWSNQGGTSSALIGRVTQQLAASFGRPMAEVETALAEQGMTWGPPFAPGRPLDPYWGVRRPPRTWDFPVGTNVQIAPRWGRISFNTLRALIDAYDVAQICVRHLVNDVRSLDYTFRPAIGVRDDVHDDIVAAREFFESPDKRQPFRSWLAEYLQDVLRYDAGALYIRRNEANDPIALEVVSGPTIIPLVDYYGRVAADEDDALAPPDGVWPGEIVPSYLQVIEGMPWDWLAGDDLLYQPWNPMPDSQYGLAPMEAVLMTANTDLRFQWHFLQYFTEGTLPVGFMEAPEDMSDPGQVTEFQDTWDALMLGDQAKLRQIRWVPHGSKFTPAKEAADKFDSEFPLYLMRRVCASFGVTPNDLGFTENVNKATSDTQIDVQFRVGTLPLVRHVEDVVNLFIAQYLKLRCRLSFDVGREIEDRVATATAEKIYIEAGVISPDEPRARLGYPIDLTRPTPRFVNNQRSGPIPLIAIESLAGTIDPETYGPTKDQPLIDHPFVAAPGVGPVLGSAEAKNAQASTAQMQRNMVSAAAGGSPAEPEPDPTAAPVDETGESAKSALDDAYTIINTLLDRLEATKEATAGLTAASGIHGSGLIGDGEGEDDAEARKTVETALVLRQWRDNSRNRLRKGLPPRRFDAADLPSEISDRVWAALQQASTRQEVDAAFSNLGKARARRAPGGFDRHKQQIIDHHSPMIRAGLAGAVPAAAIRRAVRAVYTGSAVKAADQVASEARSRAVAALTATRPSTVALTAALGALHGDAYLQGAHAAAGLAGGDMPDRLDDGLPDGYWDDWQPGQAQGAENRMSGADVTAAALAGGLLSRVAGAIADRFWSGAGQDDATSAATAAADDGDWAVMVTDNEYSTASTAGAVDTYQSNGVTQLTWVAGECAQCAPLDGTTIGIDDDWPSGPPPVHPRCDCVIVPA